jgi:poly(hydroxyalkanoate) depolymerase family esterase
MTTPFARGMTRATELTRAGRLDEATALIQSLLASPVPEPPVASPADADVLEGRFTRLDGPAPAAAPTAQNSPPKPQAARPRRPGLAETLRGIAAGGMPGPAPLSPQAVPLPDGAQFLSLTHSGPQGARTYRLYVPSARGDTPMPLVVMLHGCTQTPEDFAIGTGMNALAEEFGCLIAWPAQPQGANAQKCWNWFRPGDQDRDRGEPAVIAGIVRDIMRDHGADPARVYAAGLSAGGAAAAILGAAYPDIFAAVGVHSGLPVGAAQDVPSAFAAMRGPSDLAAMRGGVQAPAGAIRVPIIVFHGLADATVHPGNGVAVIRQSLHGSDSPAAARISGMSDRGRRYHRTRHTDAGGRILAEHWEVEGAGHAWSGGQPGGSYTDPLGPDASRLMLRFFLDHRRE